MKSLISAPFGTWSILQKANYETFHIKEASYVKIRLMDETVFIPGHFPVSVTKYLSGGMGQ